MKTFKQLTEAASTYVFTFGRFNPPTIGHKLLIDEVLSVANGMGAAHGIYVSKSVGAPNNPLPLDVKLHFMKLMFPEVSVIPAAGDIGTFVKVAASISGHYDNLIMVAGSDRVDEFTKVLNSYNGREFNFESIKVISAGERSPDSPDALGMSSTKMRVAAYNGNLSEFKRGVGNLLTPEQTLDMFNAVRQGLKRSSVKESTIRDQYVTGELFKCGSKVTDGTNIFEVVSRGSNSVMVEKDGVKQKVWLDAIKPYTDLTYEEKVSLSRISIPGSEGKRYALEIQDAISEEVEVCEDRWLLQHRSIPRGRSVWFFTSRAIGPVDYQDESVFHQAQGSYSDAKRSARVWARQHGHSKVYLFA